jgi:O-6-methylguanine DNA methyltransferase
MASINANLFTTFCKKMTYCEFSRIIGSLEIHFRAQFQDGFLEALEPNAASKSNASCRAKEQEAFFEWLKYYQKLDRDEQWNCLQPAGTEFQLRAWRALFQVPWGALCTYRDLAVAVGKPQGAQAIGQAVARNPISLLIPCHRVIRSDGTLGGFQWGRELKTALLEAEKGSELSWFWRNPSKI